jgi:Subtilisin inhibitor-like
MRSHTGKARPGAWYLLTAAICTIMVTACGSTVAPSGAASGSSPSSGGSGSTGSSPGAGAQPAKISLDIQVSHGRGTAIRHWTLRCQPAGGTHPDPAAACRVLLHAKNPFGPLRKGIMCPMIVAGSEVAKIRGTWHGKPVNITMNQGGCWLARWNEIGQIFN